MRRRPPPPPPTPAAGGGRARRARRARDRAAGRARRGARARRPPAPRDRRRRAPARRARGVVKGGGELRFHSHLFGVELCDAKIRRPPRRAGPRDRRRGGASPRRRRRRLGAPSVLARARARRRRTTRRRATWLCRIRNSTSSALVIRCFWTRRSMFSCSVLIARARAASASSIVAFDRALASTSFSLYAPRAIEALGRRLARRRLAGVVPRRLRRPRLLAPPPPLPPPNIPLVSFAPPACCAMYSVVLALLDVAAPRLAPAVRLGALPPSPPDTPCFTSSRAAARARAVVLFAPPPTRSFDGDSIFFGPPRAPRRAAAPNAAAAPAASSSSSARLGRRRRRLGAAPRRRPADSCRHRATPTTWRRGASIAARSGSPGRAAASAASRRRRSTECRSTSQHLGVELRREELAAPRRGLEAAALLRRHNLLQLGVRGGAPAVGAGEEACVRRRPWSRRSPRIAADYKASGPRAPRCARREHAEAAARVDSTPSGAAAPPPLRRPPLWCAWRQATTRRRRRAAGRAASRSSAVVHQNAEAPSPNQLARELRFALDLDCCWRHRCASSCFDGDSVRIGCAGRRLDRGRWPTARRLRWPTTSPATRHTVMSAMAAAASLFNGRRARGGDARGRSRRTRASPEPPHAG